MAKTNLYLNVDKAPFWFTSDSTLYLSYKVDQVEVDLDKLTDIAKKELETALGNKTIYLDKKELLDKNLPKEVILPEDEKTVPSEKDFLAMKIADVVNLIAGLQTLEDVEQIAKYELNRSVKPRAKVTQAVVERRNALGAGPNREAADVLTPKEALILKPKKED